MKKHITVDQLKETNVIKLRKPLNDKWYDFKLVEFFGERDDYLQEVTLTEMADYITIGKMIEILSQRTDFFEINNSVVNIFKGETFGSIKYDMNYNYGSNNKYENLCDALWEAVKYVLEEK